jgi:hypothetical protein
MCWHRHGHCLVIAGLRPPHAARFFIADENIVRSAGLACIDQVKDIGMKRLPGKRFQLFFRKYFPPRGLLKKQPKAILRLLLFPRQQDFLACA